MLIWELYKFVMTITTTRTASLNKQQLLTIKKALEQYINFNIGVKNPQRDEFVGIVNVLQSQLDDDW